MKIIDENNFEDVSPVFKGQRGHKVADLLMRLCAIDKINLVYDRSINYTGAEFAARLLKDLGVNYTIGNAERLKMLPEGAFITVSNHPYGGLDGIILINLMAEMRPDYKFMVNRILSLVKTMQENFISVMPKNNVNTGVNVTSITGIRETLTHLHNGHPVGFFPSGAVSDFSLKNLKVMDRTWQEGIIRLIASAKVPIIPIRFFDRNSWFFYFLGMINWKIRLLRLPSELFNKCDQRPRIGIGKIISVKEQEQYPDARSLGLLLRKAVYEMPMPASFVPKTLIHIPEPIIESA